MAGDCSVLSIRVRAPKPWAIRLVLFVLAITGSAAIAACLWVRLAKIEVV